MYPNHEDMLVSADYMTPREFRSDEISDTAGHALTHRIFVGNLSTHSRSEDIEKLLYQYGKITVLGRSGPGPHPRFACVEFEDPRDAEDAVCTWEGYIYNGRKLRVEREIRGHKGRKSQHKATRPGGQIQTLPKPRGHCRTNGTPPAKSSPETEQLIEFEDNLETKTTQPLTIEEVTAIKGLHNWDNPSTFPRSDICATHGAPTTMGTPTPLADLTTVKDDDLDYGPLGEGFVMQHAPGAHTGGYTSPAPKDNSGRVATLQARANL
jgi:RNA recognition motif-containing protein